MAGHETRCLPLGPSPGTAYTVNCAYARLRSFTRKPNEAVDRLGCVSLDGRVAEISEDLALIDKRSCEGVCLGAVKMTGLERRVDQTIHDALCASLKRVRQAEHRGEHRHVDPIIKETHPAWKHIGRFGPLCATGAHRQQTEIRIPAGEISHPENADEFHDAVYRKDIKLLAGEGGTGRDTGELLRRRSWESRTLDPHLWDAASSFAANKERGLAQLACGEHAFQERRVAEHILSEDARDTILRHHHRSGPPGAPSVHDQGIDRALK